jgi:hypothetical protein
MVRARPGRLSALRVFHSKSGLYGAFVKVRRALNSQKRRFPARAVVAIAAVCVEGATNRGPLGGILGPKRGGSETIPLEELLLAVDTSLTDEGAPASSAAPPSTEAAPGVSSTEASEEASELTWRWALSFCGALLVANATWVLVSAVRTSNNCHHFYGGGGCGERTIGLCPGPPRAFKRP